MAMAIAGRPPGAAPPPPRHSVAAPDIEDAAVLDAEEVRTASGRPTSKSKAGWASEASSNAKALPASGRQEDMVHSLSEQSQSEGSVGVGVGRLPALQSWKTCVRWLGTSSSDEELEEQAVKEEVENRRARDEIVKALRKHPSVLVGLALRADCTAREIMATLTDLHDVPGTLRRSGCNPKELAHLLHLWPRALRAVPPEDLAKTVPWRCICTLSWAFLAAAIAGLMLFMVTNYTSGWSDDGICNIRSFTNDTTCTHQPCLVNVEVRKPGSAEQYMKKGWRLPMEKDMVTGIVAVRGNAFRCCNSLGRILDCCGLYDPNYFEFCDNWPHTLDLVGDVCPDGSWRCMFKLSNAGAGRAAEVTELKDYDPPGLLPYLAGIGACVITCILITCSAQFKRCMHRCCGCAGNVLTRFDTWISRQAMLDGGGLEEGVDQRPSLTPPTTLLDTTKGAFNKRPTKERQSILSKPRQALEAELPETPRIAVAKPGVSAQIALAEAHKDGANGEHKMAAQGPKAAQDKSSRRMQQNQERSKGDDSPKEDTPPSKDKFGPLKENPVHLSLASFAERSGNMLLAPIIEPLPPNNVSARSSNASARSGRSKSSGHSRQSPRPPTDPAEGWAWGNKDQLGTNGQLPVEGSNTRSLRSNSQGSRPPGSARLLGNRPGTSPGVAAPLGKPTIIMPRPASVDGHVTEPHSLRVNAGSSGAGHSSRSTRSPGAEADADEIFATASPRLRQQSRGHERGAAFAAAAVRGRVH